jgi:hypothetical protein
VDKRCEEQCGRSRSDTAGLPEALAVEVEGVGANNTWYGAANEVRTRRFMRGAASTL